MSCVTVTVTLITLLLKKILIEKIRHILNYARRLADLGEGNLRHIPEFLSGLSQSEQEKFIYIIQAVVRKS